MNCNPKKFNQKQVLGIQLISGFLLFSVLLTGCEESTTPEILVDKINMTEMAEAHLKDFEITNEDIGYQGKGKQLIFQSNVKKSTVIMYFEICSSGKEAKHNLFDIFNDMPGQLIEEPYDGVSMGENFWWSPMETTTQVRNIVFLRYNVYFILISTDIELLVNLAKSIDDDLLKGATYISYL